MRLYYLVYGTIDILLKIFFFYCTLLLYKVYTITDEDVVVVAAGKKISFDTTIGRTLIRKEVIQFVINLSSSVGVKGAEQGLLR